jgi:hypothetical protein
MIVGRLPLLLVLMVVVSGMPASTAAAAIPGHGRAWELISPSDPVAGIVFRPLAQSPDGVRFAYMSAGPMPGAQAGDLVAANLGTREPSGWISEPLSPPFAWQGDTGLFASFPVAFSRDVSTAIWAAEVPLTADAPPEGTFALYRRSALGQLSLLVALDGSEPRLVRVSEDGRHVVFTSTAHLVPADAARTSEESVYEIDERGLRMVDVDTAGQLLSPCGATIGRENAVSRSAERIFFTTWEPDCSGLGRVYMREGGTTTVEIGESRCGRPDCNGFSPATFAGATPSGSSAFLVTAQQLTDADLDEAADLYRYDAGSGELVLLSGAAPAPGQVLQQELAWSSDGTRVYFFANGPLVPGEGAEGETSLYLSDASGLRRLASLPETRLRVSANGETLLLATPAALEAADTDGRSDVYRYDAAADAFARLSTGPAGGNGDFDAVLDSALESRLIFSMEPITMNQLSSDGAHAFFTTAEQLVAGDANQFADLYEWSAGSVALISSGTASENVQFASATGDARSAIFGTSASLLGRDRDGGEYDFYAARLGGGFPEPVAPDECEQSDCTVRGGGAGVMLPALASTRAPKHGRRGRLRFGRIAATAGRDVSRAGTTRVTVFVPRPGMVRVLATVDGGREGRVVARGRAGAARAGRLTVVLRFAPSVRRRLRHGVDVPVRLVLRLGSERAVERLRLTSEDER